MTRADEVFPVPAHELIHNFRFLYTKGFALGYINSAFYLEDPQKEQLEGD
jgi:hypothetical protein